MSRLLQAARGPNGLSHSRGTRNGFGSEELQQQDAGLSTIAALVAGRSRCAVASTMEVLAASEKSNSRLGFHWLGLH